MFKNLRFRRWRPFDPSSRRWCNTGRKPVKRCVVGCYAWNFELFYFNSRSSKYVFNVSCLEAVIKSRVDRLVGTPDRVIIGIIGVRVCLT